MGRIMIERDEKKCYLLCTFVMWCTKQLLKYVQPVAAGGNSFTEKEWFWFEETVQSSRAYLPILYLKFLEKGIYILMHHFNYSLCNTGKLLEI